MDEFLIKLIINGLTKCCLRTPKARLIATAIFLLFINMLVGWLITTNPLKDSGYTSYLAMVGTSYITSIILTAGGTYAAKITSYANKNAFWITKVDFVTYNWMDWASLFWIIIVALLSYGSLKSQLFGL